ncbi:MAG: 4a-hydroxytetrahydrobiopterin dehydratase, partial [Acidimicrobiia bacterium]|nr:4a-hydroxytetrahydrobiopterin dehydratase [Acidimicrobiia bacterium]
MSSPISARTFHEADGVDDWRAIFWGACAVFRTPDYATAGRFVTAIAAATDALDHQPDIDMRPGTVAVRTFTPGGTARLSDLDITVAQRISEAAREIGLEADPSSVQHVQFTIDVVEGEPVKDFWQAALGYERVDEDDIVDP